MLSLFLLPVSFKGPPAVALGRARATTLLMKGPPVFSNVEDLVPFPAPADFDTYEFAQTLPGTGPLGFFDPAGFCSSDNKEGAATEGKVRFYREVELKHGRIAMLAAVGFLIAEVFHPFFGGSIDVPSYVAFQQTPLQTFWPVVVGIIAMIEVFSIIPAFENPNIEGWASAPLC